MIQRKRKGEQQVYNLAIVDDNIFYVKNLANKILSDVNDVRLVKIATDGNEAYEYLMNGEIDILILDLNLPEISGIQLLETIYGKRKKNIPKIIIISGDNSMLQYKEFSKFNVSDCLNKGVGFDSIVRRTINIINEIEENNKKIILDSMVTEELLKIGYNFKHNGTKYLKESIIFLLNEQNDDLIENLEKNVYSHIARMHRKSIGNIKNNIVKATNNMYFECNEKFLLEYFSYEYDTKPTPKIVIQTILNKICMSVVEVK